jgi:hypothetical protein
MVIGRHGDRGTFEYFVRELGYGLLPWIALVPAALGWAVMRGRRTAGEAAPDPAEIRKQEIVRLGAIWFVAAYAMVSLSMTKFHHYVLPAIPGLAIVVGCFLDDLIARGSWRRAAVVALIGLPLLGLVAIDLVDTKSSAQRFLWLFSYDYVHNKSGRPWPDRLDFTGPLIAFCVMFAVATAALAAPRIRRWAAYGLSAAAIVFTFYLLDGFMRGVAPSWSQKGPIAAYYEHRRSPDERLIAYQLYWRGETFYTSNEIYEGPTEERTVFDQDGADDRLKDWMSRHRGRRAFFLYERFQQARLQGLLPAEARGSFHVVDEQNNKFSLAQVDL